MSQIVVDLSKKVKIVADMMKLDGVKAQVGVYIDGSGSMESGSTYLYTDGTVQNTINRIAAVALQFDDNGELDTSIFSRSITEAPVVKLSNVDGYVKRELLDKRRVPFGSTNYAPIIEHAVAQYFDNGTVQAVKASASGVVDALKNVFGFGKKEAPAAAPVGNGKSKSGYPVYVIIITDGDNFDEKETTALLTAMQDKNIYFQFVGIGTATTFKYCNEVADALPNVGFFQIPDLNAMKDMELYKKLMNPEFAEWMKKF